MLKSELYKAFHNKGMYLACIIGAIFAALAFFIDDKGLITQILSIQKQDEWGIIYKNKSTTGINIYSAWMGLRPCSSQYILFFLFPLICVIPHGMSYCKDMKSGYINQILSRVSYKKYYGSKLLAVMISGGFVCAAPLVVNFLLCMCVFPLSEPVIGCGEFNIFNLNVLSRLFCEHALLYVAIYVVFVFLYMGIIAAMALGVTCMDKNIFIVLSTPFIIVFAMHTVCTWLLGNEKMSPMRIISMNTIYIEDLNKIFVEIILIIFVSFPFVIKIFQKKGDVL